MKKILIFTSIFIVGIYLSSAINIVLNSGQKLEGSSWNNLSSALNKVDVSGSNLSVNGKLAVDGKICLEDGSCLGECEEGFHWDNSTVSCKEDCIEYFRYGSNGFGTNRTDLYGYTLETCKARGKSLGQMCELSVSNGRCICSDTLSMFNVGTTNWYILDCR